MSPQHTTHVTIEVKAVVVRSVVTDDSVVVGVLNRKHMKRRIQTKASITNVVNVDVITAETRWFMYPLFYFLLWMMLAVTFWL